MEKSLQVPTARDWDNIACLQWEEERVFVAG